MYFNIATRGGLEYSYPKETINTWGDKLIALIRSLHIGHIYQQKTVSHSQVQLCHLEYSFTFEDYLFFTFSYMCMFL